MTGGAVRDRSAPFAPVQLLTRHELQAAIASVTRALGTASGDAVVVLATERAAMRAELAQVLTETDVIALSA
jgi:hypothetical protein